MKENVGDRKRTRERNKWKCQERL